MLLSLLLTAASAKGILVVDMLAIARLENGKWSNLVSKPSDPVGKLKDITFTNIGLTGPKGFVKAPKLELQDDVAEGWYASGETWADKVLWVGTAPKFPSAVSYSPTAKVYLDVVQAHLRSQGLNQAKARINKVVGVDLDSDGVREVVIEAATFADMVPRTMDEGKPTDYSSILIRWVKKGKPVTMVVEHHDAKKDHVYGSADQLRAIADFDGDGNFEVVCSSDYYEGQSASVYRFRRGVLKKLVEYGAGV